MSNNKDKGNKFEDEVDEEVDEEFNLEMISKAEGLVKGIGSRDIREEGLTVVDEGELTGHKSIDDKNKEANKIIRFCCYKVAVVSLAAYSALLLPGVAELVAIIFGQAAAAGILAKVQTEMVAKLSEIYESEVEEVNNDRIATAYGVATGAVLLGSQIVPEEEEVEEMGENTRLKAFAYAVAKASKVKFVDTVPVIGPLTLSAIATTTAYLIGRRTKKYYVQRALQRKEGEVDDSKIELETWNESVKGLTGYDKDEVGKIFDHAIGNSRDKMAYASKAAGNMSVSSKAKVDSMVKSSSRQINIKYKKGKMEVTQQYHKGKKIVGKKIEAGKEGLGKMNLGEKYSEGKKIVNKKIEAGKVSFDKMNVAEKYSEGKKVLNSTLTSSKLGTIKAAAKVKSAFSKQKKSANEMEHDV